MNTAAASLIKRRLVAASRGSPIFRGRGKSASAAKIQPPKVCAASPAGGRYHDTASAADNRRWR
jgi:hypothetical protein